METQVKKWNYGNYSSSNYGAHSLAIRVGSLEIHFSYDTVIAFADSSDASPRRICENVWSATTGKHLNWINPDKSRRIPYAQFEAELAEVLRKHNLMV